MVLKLVKSHWKKISIAAIPTYFGFNYVNDYLQTSFYMRRICREISQLPQNNYQNVLVILNPVSNKKKCEKLFSAHCEPVLHAAGFSVNVVKTSHAGHAKTILESLEVLPDVVIVAGGDGTSSEVVTGLLRRKEPPCPVLLLPLGEKNESYKNIKGVNEVKLTDSCLPLVLERVKFCNVFKYEVMDNEDTLRKPIFGLNKISWGFLRNLEEYKEKNWSLRYLKNELATVLASFSSAIKWNICANIIYSPPCSGCSKCVTYKTKSVFSVSNLFGNKRMETAKVYKEINPLCGLKRSFTFEANQMDIKMEQCNSSNKLETEIINAYSPGIDFIKQIFTTTKAVPSMKFESQTIELIPIEKGLTYAIDGNEYDALPIKMCLIPNALKLFC